MFAAAAMFFLLMGAGIGQNTTRVTLDQAIDLALAHNHSLQATRTLILQNQAQEITANLRPNPTFGVDSQFVRFRAELRRHFSNLPNDASLLVFHGSAIVCERSNTHASIFSAPSLQKKFPIPLSDQLEHASGGVGSERRYLSHLQRNAFSSIAGHRHRESERFPFFRQLRQR
jgi:hypothetical protein